VFQPSLFEIEHPVDLEAFHRALKSTELAVDIETETRWSGLGPKQEFGLSYAAEITVIALAWREGETILTTALASPFNEEVKASLKTLFQPDRTIIAHNAVFDIRQLSKYTDGVTPEHVWDTMIMARLLHPHSNMSYGLLSVAAMLDVPFSAEQARMKTERNALHKQPLETTLAYAKDDARVALQIYEKQRAMKGNEELVDWEMRAMREYCRMTAQGIRLNLSYIDSYLPTLYERREEAALRLRQDGLYTPSSPKARAKYLYEQKGIPIPDWNPDSYYFTRAGRRRLSKMERPEVLLSDLSTSADVIAIYIEQDSTTYASLKDLSLYLDTDWLISTLESLREHAAVDGRIHSLVTIATDTGRRAASHPQMQNWKMPDMAGVAIGSEGFTLVEIDYSIAENVMAALIASDSNLAAACQTDDFHSTMASRYFGEQWQQAEGAERKRLRDISKKITYGTAYGMGARRLSDSIGVSLEEGQAFLRAKDTAFSAVARTRRMAESQVRQNGMLTLWTGRPVAVTTAFVAWNYLCQGGVSEMLKRAIVLTSETYRQRGMRSRVALDMHDALILEVAHEEWNEAIDIASSIMSNITPAELNNRTQPPIQWVAKPKLIENAKKWGAMQWHPEG
jgi:DNA polymerase I